MHIYQRVSPLSLEEKKTRPRIQVRAKARNAAVALERLLEERFAEPEALGADPPEGKTAVMKLDELLYNSDI